MSLAGILLVLHFREPQNPAEQLAFKAKRVELAERSGALASEAEKSAVMAITDEDSQNCADQARTATAASVKSGQPNLTPARGPIYNDAPTFDPLKANERQPARSATVGMVTGTVSALKFCNDLGPQENDHRDRLHTDQSHHCRRKRAVDQVHRRDDRVIPD